jgi:hypothetical protein
MPDARMHVCQQFVLGVSSGRCDGGLRSGHDEAQSLLEQSHVGAGPPSCRSSKRANKRAMKQTIELACTRACTCACARITCCVSRSCCACECACTRAHMLKLMRARL